MDAQTDDAMTDAQLREELARRAHEDWAHWTKYMLGVLQPLIDAGNGTNTDSSWDPEIAAADAAIDRWRRQIDTPYADLTEAEKDSNRVFADKTLALLKELWSLAQHTQVHTALPRPRCQRSAARF